MKRYSALVRLLLLLCGLSILPTTARADYVYTVTSTLSAIGIFSPTQFSFTQPTLASSGLVTSGLTQISGATAKGFAWNSAVSGECLGESFDGFGCGAISFVFANGITFAAFDGGSFLAPGTYVGIFEGTTYTTTVNIAQTGVPEPSSLLLLSSGILGLLGAARRKSA